MFALAAAATVAAVAIAQTTATIERSRSLGGARFLAGRMAQARAQAVARSATVALKFDVRSDGVAFSAFVDANRNGVRSDEIAGSVDPMIEAPRLLSELFPGVTIAFAPDTGDGAAPQIGSSSLISFTAAGTATSGTVFVRGRDGSQYAVRVFGPTGRTRVLRYEPRTQTLADLR
jgi:hypothetical protein